MGKFSLMQEASAKDPLDFGVLGGDEDGVPCGFFGLGISSGEVESSGFEFAGFGIVLIPPEGLGGRDKGTVISSRRPKFVFLFAEAGCGEEKEG